MPTYSATEKVQPRIVRFFLVQNTKTGKNILNGHKIFHGLKIDRMVTKYTKIFNCKILQNLLQKFLDVWFGNKLSGNPGQTNSKVC
jgi:hypothetical protein